MCVVGGGALVSELVQYMYAPNLSSGPIHCTQLRYIVFWKPRIEGEQDAGPAYPRQGPGAMGEVCVWCGTSGRLHPADAAHRTPHAAHRAPHSAHRITRAGRCTMVSRSDEEVDGPS